MTQHRIDHILRPKLPWRDTADRTECGLSTSEVTTLTRDDYFDRLREMGKQRASLFTCMTCSSTAQRWATWETDPRKAVGREIELETRGRNKETQLLDELKAIERLVENHREEFDSLVAELSGRREWLAKKEARK